MYYNFKLLAVLTRKLGENTFSLKFKGESRFLTFLSLNA